MGQPNLLLREARENVGLTQAEIAEKLGVRVNTYSGWECGDHKPYLRQRPELAKILNMSLAKVNALFRDDDSTSGNDASTSGRIELNEASEYREEQKKFLEGDLGSRLLNIVDAGTYTDQCKAFAQIVERFDAMNTESQTYLVTRRQAVISLATFPFVPPINLEKRDRVPSSYYELFLQECGASLTACEELAKSSNPDDLALAFRCVCRYLVELEVISNSPLSRYRQQALELAAHCAILKALLGWDCKGNTAALVLAQDAIRIARDSDNICLQLSAYSKLAWAYLYGDERELALETARDARDLLEKHKEQRFPICIRGGTYSTLSVMQARNGLDPDTARKKAMEQGPDNEIQFLLQFTGGNMWMEQGDALCYFGATGNAINAYAQIIDRETLEVTKPFQRSCTEDWQLSIIEGMARASLEGEVRNMENAIRYWTAAIEGAKRMKSESKYRRALALHDDMKIAFSGEKEVHNLRDHFRRGKSWT